uniref:Synapsin n=1 Tax=Bactrocera dorsalis TaxID=27457 RepID=A0A034WKD7_BACDO
MSVSASSAASYSSKPSSSVLDTFQEENKYKPVTNFEPQERVNPFDKGVLKTSATNQTIGSAVSTTSSSSISSSSISSRINRNGNVGIKSPPPPTGPPPPPPTGAIASSSYRNSTSTTPPSAGKDNRTFNYGSSTSIETITRMDTNTTNTTTAGPSSDAAPVAGALADDNNATGVAGGATSSTSGGPDWKSKMGIRSASVYSAPANLPAAGDTSGYASNSSPASNAYNTTADLPSYTRPSYSRSESNASNKQSDLDIIFGDTNNAKPSHGNGKYTRASGSLSDAELIFGGPPTNYKADRFGASKSMSVTSERSNDGNDSYNAYRNYEGIQNAAFSDFSDSPKTGSVSSINSFGNTNRWNKPTVEEDDELDLK